MKTLHGAAVVLGAVAAFLVVSAGAGAGAGPRSYVVTAQGNGLPSGLAQAIEQAGGALTGSLPQIGVAFASSSSGTFAADAAAIAGVRSVSPNLTLQWLKPTEAVAAPEFGYPPTSGDNDTLFDLQWGQAAVDSVGAWNAGFRGAGADIAILDTGFNLTHPDLAPNIASAASMIAGDPPSWTGPPTAFSHGTHVAGIAAAPDNALGTIGTAPLAKLHLVKVLSDTGSGTFEDVVQGIVYAADQGADIINMSLGAMLLRRGEPDHPTEPYTARDAAKLAAVMGRATSYAYQRGVTVIASAGNSAIDAEHTADVFHLPSDAPHVNSISATGPLGWGVDPSTDLDVPAFYTNFGQSVISFAAPGGNVDFDLLASGALCTVAGITRPCWVFDLVLSPGGGGAASWFWAAGTSMSAPHVSGVAAIIIGANGGSMRPAQVAAELARSADDLGKPGNDDFYGAGRVNAANFFDG